MTGVEGALVLLAIGAVCAGAVGLLAVRDVVLRRRAVAAELEIWLVEEHNRLEMAKLRRREVQPPIVPVVRHAEVRSLEDIYRRAVAAPL